MTESNKSFAKGKGSYRQENWKISDREWQYYLVTVLIVALFYGLLDLRTAFQGDWIVQDDARQHVFWMMRYVDSELFPQDWIADYFQSVAPFGYTSLYEFVASWGIDPLVFNKLIPLGLRLVITYYFFLFCRQIFPLPFGCLLATLFLNHSIWLKDDIVSATPRAFLYPFLIAFLYYLTKNALIPCAISIIGLGLFYPQIVFIVSGILVLKLIEWRGFIPTLTSNKQHRSLALIGLVVAFGVMLPYAIHTSDYAPVISRAEAFTMPEFHYGGRSNFFKENVFEYLVGKGNGILISTSVFNPIILLSALFLPWVMRQPQQFPLVTKITSHLDVLIKLLLSSLGMYLLAHIFLFRLHLPSRYTTHSLRIIVAICAGITVTVLLDRILTIIQTKYPQSQRKFLATLTLITIILLTYSNFLDYHSPTGYKIGSYPALYEFFQQQPKDIVIASLAKETDNLPTFTQRSVLVSREYAIPYQLGYYKPFSQKVRALITAQYSQNLETVKQFIRQYNVSFWLLEDESFTVEYVAKNRWLKQYRMEYDRAIANLKNGNKPIVAKYRDICRAFSTAKFTVIKTQCLLEQKNPIVYNTN